MDETFFIEQRTQSFIKTEIVRKYFHVWSKIMIVRNKVSKLVYVDLFSGPGTYEDGNPSTPIEILKYCIADEKLRDRMVFIFNDASEEVIDKLSENIENLTNATSLKYPPQLIQSEVGQDFTDTFSKINLAPTFSFVDPFGYKGVTRELIFSLIKDFGSDCILFFNYNRVQMGIGNRLVDGHMKNLFGAERHEQMKKTIPTLEKEMKEAYILEMLSQSLSNNGRNLILPFKFLSDTKNQTSHYLILVSKSPIGYQIMKDIMAGESSIEEDGVACFGYIPVKHLKNRKAVQLTILDSYEGEMDNLKARILKNFKNQSLKMISIFENDNIGTNYTKKNYKEAIRQLEAEGKVTVTPPANKRRMDKKKGVVTVGDDVIVTI